MGNGGGGGFGGGAGDGGFGVPPANFGFDGAGDGGPGDGVPGPGYGVPPPQAVPPWNATTLIMEHLLNLITPNHWMVLLFLQHNSCNVGGKSPIAVSSAFFRTDLVNVSDIVRFYSRWIRTIVVAWTWLEMMDICTRGGQIFLRLRLASLFKGCCSLALARIVGFCFQE